MIVKLNAQKKHFESFVSKGFDKQQVKAMVQAYRKKPEAKDSLNYAHFNAFEILELLIANDVVSEPLSRAIKDEQESIEDFGLKIYMGSHCFPLTEPLPGTIDAAQYSDKTTTILCNTRIIKKGANKGFWDLLDDERSIALAEGTIDPGQGLDQSEISPPYTVTSPDPNGEQDVNNAP